MQVPDLINGIFEASGTFFIYLHIRKLHHDKEVKGVHFAPVAFFAAWGFWNLFYYPHLGQWFSFAGGCGIVAANVVWLAQLLYYLRHPNPPDVPYYGAKPPRPISIREAHSALRESIDNFLADESSGPAPGAFAWWNRNDPFKD